MLPSAVLLDEDERFSVTMTPDEWSEWLRLSDNPEILVNGSLEKAFHRKLRYDISGHVQQKVWVADGCKCMYCGQPMGKVQLTIDHFIPLEMGGKNDPSNYISADRRCNKDKGGMDPREWVASRKCKPDPSAAPGMYATYEWYVDYLSKRVLP